MSFNQHSDYTARPVLFKVRVIPKIPENRNHIRNVNDPILLDASFCNLFGNLNDSLAFFIIVR